MKTLVLVLAALVLAGCGSHAATRRVSPPKPSPRCAAAKARALAKLARDTAAIRRAANLPTKDKLIGNDAMNKAIDRFLIDLSKAPVTNLQRNRLIDHAAALAHSTCEQCFQALEAERPIVSIAHAGAGKGCRG